MKLITYRTDGSTKAGLLEGDQVRPLPYRSVDEVLRATSLDDVGDGTGDPIPLSEVSLAPLVVRPGKIVCLGKNYAAHVEEMGREEPDFPTLFAKYPSALAGADDPIPKPRESDQLDWEVELAVVIGRSIRRASPEEALDAVAGYTVSNDFSVRDWQFRTGEWLQGKTFDGTTPLGPALVTPDELDDATDLRITCTVDGELMQESRTSLLLVNVAEALSYISQPMSLAPGDVVLTGTPSGVGAGRSPQRFLAPGEVVVSAIEGLGECRNEIVSD